MADSAQFLIDIAAKLAGGDTAVAGLTTIGDKMLGAGATAQQLDAAVKGLSATFEAAKASSSAAAAAVEEGQAAYDQASVAADKAAKAVERIGLAADAQRGKLKTAMDAGDDSGAEKAAAKLQELVGKQGDAAAAADTAKAALEAEGAALDKLKSAAAASADKQEEVGKALENTSDAAKTAAKSEEAAGGSGNLRELGMALGRLGGPLGSVGRSGVMAAQAFKKMSSSLGSAGPYVAIAVALLAITVGAIAATVAIAHWAIGLADGNRNARLTTEGIEASSASLAGLGAIMVDVQAETGVATDALQKMAEGLAAAKISAAAMPDALRAVATATAGGATAEFLAKLNADLKSGTKSAAELAAEVDAKFGGIVAKKMLSLDAQSQKLKTNIAGVFGDLDIESFLEGLAKLVNLFNDGTASGRAMKFLFESIFQPIVDGATAAIPSVERLFLLAEVMALKAYIALQPYTGILKIVGYAFLFVVGVIVGVVAGAFAILATLIGGAFAVATAIVVVIYAVVDGLYLLAAAIVGGAVSAWGAWIGAIRSAIDWLEGLSLGDIGANLIQGLADGISGAGSAVISAITGVVGGAITAAKALLHINSPSKVFAEIGGYTAEGFSMGVEGGTDDAQSALEAMVSPADGKGGGSGPMGYSSGLTLSGNTFNYYGVEDADDCKARTLESFLELLEGDVVGAGGGEVPATE